MGSTVITNETIFGKLFLIIFKFCVRYIANWFLLAAIICFCIPLILFTVTTGIEVSFSFFQYFTFINPNFAVDDGVIELSDFVKVFLFISFFIMLFVQFVQLILQKLFHISLELTFKRKIVFAVCVVTALYVFTLIAALFTGNGFFNTISVMIFFYVMTLISVLGYMCLCYVSRYAGVPSK